MLRNFGLYITENAVSTCGRAKKFFPDFNKRHESIIILSSD